MRPSSQPVPSGSWTCAYVPAASNPWQVTAIVSGVSGNPSYGSAWAWGNGYRWRVQLPQWDTGKPYVAASHLQNSNLGGAAAPWWKPSASVTTADFVIWRMANSIVACGDDNISYSASVVTYVSPSAKLFATYEWRQSISV